VRLRDGSSSLDGRLEVLKGGVWGTVCDSFFNMQKGIVVCRQLGFLGARETFSFTHYPMASSNTPIALSSVLCDGTEAQLGDCYGVLDSWSTASCSHADDVGVVCVGKATILLLNCFFL